MASTTTSIWIAGVIGAAALLVSAPGHSGTPTRDEVQKLAHEGKIGAGDCIADSVVKSGDEPTILFRNSCDYQVNVQLCARKSGDTGPSYFLIILQGRTETRHRLWLKSGQTFHYTYNSCGRPYCTPPNSDC
jgi:hypothetical protein